MTRRKWSRVAWVMAIGVGLAVRWAAVKLGMTSGVLQLLIMWGVIGLGLTITRRAFGVPAPRPSGRHVVDAPDAGR
jgi:hypothetical protein